MHSALFPTSSLCQWTIGKDTGLTRTDSEGFVTCNGVVLIIHVAAGGQG